MIMRQIPKFVVAALFLFTMIACESESQSVDPSFEAAQGWILVKNGTVPEVADAIREYDTLRRNDFPGHFSIELHAQRRGYVAVVLPDGLPAYDLPNLTGWLNAPPGHLRVSDAVAWIISPGTKEKYYLEPEKSNPWGDTLIGARSTGTPVRVYLPSTGLSEVSSGRPYRNEPDVQLTESPITLQVTLDTNTAFGNPLFVIDSPMDHDWRP
jgi:hypothetical protein